MNFIKMPKNHKAARICKEWAKDFDQRGMADESAYFLTMGKAFYMGLEVEEVSVSAFLEEVESRISTSAECDIFDIPASVKSALKEIGNEAEYMKSIFSEKGLENE